MTSTKKEIIQCNVCVENLNFSSRIAVECGFCSYTACKSCYKRYFTDSYENPHCMSCKKEWDYKFLIDKFDRRFIDTKYKKHRENILIDRERGLMIATQPLVEREILNEQKQLQIKQLQLQRMELSRQENQILASMITHSNAERKQFIRKCTKQDCRGFLSSQWKCGLCESWSCPECHDLIGLVKENHVCHPDTLATAKLIDQDTKTCPKCSTGIFKIDGCDMMFCVECHTSFSWRTGKIETGVIHNPHYFEWLQKSGTAIERNPNEIRCGREIDQYFITHVLRPNVVRFKSVLDEKQTRDIENRSINLIHMRAIDLESFSVDNIHDNVDLRILYMRNKINEDDFKRILQQREKRNTKKKEFFNIFSMFINCQTEMMYRIVERDQNPKNIILESNNLLIYTNECLLSLASVYKSNPLVISHLFILSNRR